MSSFRQPVAPPVVCFLAALVFPSVTRADGIRWRNDYAKALKEAVDTDRPLLLNIGTENCYWCKQLDARTFKNAEVIKLLNDRFIPLKVDGDRTTYLVQALKIQSYPTLVFASAEGTILGFREGFIEADKLQPQMLRVLATVGVPDWMRKDLADATKAVAAGEHAKAVTLLQGIVEDGKSRPIQARARKTLAELEKKAADAMAKARGLAEAGKKTEAVAALTKMEKTYAGTLASRQGKQLRSQLTSKQEEEDDRPKKAKQLLAEAKLDLEVRAYLRCLDRCSVLTAQYADLPEGAEANKIATEIKGNTEWAKHAADQLGERLCELYLSLADSSVKKALPQQAVFYLERIVKLFPLVEARGGGAHSAGATAGGTGVGVSG